MHVNVNVHQLSQAVLLLQVLLKHVVKESPSLEIYSVQTKFNTCLLDFAWGVVAGSQ